MSDTATDRRVSTTHPTADSIRVAHVGELSETSASGVDRTVAGLVTHLGPFGVTPEVWHLSNRYASVRERRSGTIRVFELPSHPRLRSAASRLPKATRRFIHERRQQIDVLHLHSVFIPDNVWVVREARLPYVITPNGGYSREVIHGRNRLAKAIWMRMRERRYIRDASLVHAVSPPELDELRATFRTGSFLYAPNAIDASTVPLVAANRVAPPRGVVFLGRLDVAHKGLDLLLEGYARYIAEHGAAGVELIVAGPDVRSGMATLKAMSEALPSETQPRFLGPVFGDDKEALLKAAYVFVHTSRWEGMPYAVLEALATGCPVLITAATNLGAFVTEYGAGVVVDATAEDIAGALASLVDLPPEKYRRMCSDARKLAQERFSWTAVAEEISAAYRTLVP